MCASWLLRAIGRTLGAIGICSILWANASFAAEETLFRTAGGLTTYVGVMPAELVKGPPPRSAEGPMHGRLPKGRHDYHVVAAIFDASTGARISDATVLARVSGLGLSGVQKTLEPMRIAETTTYGAFFNMPPDVYAIRVTVQRPSSQPVVLEFKYDHRRQ